MRLVERTTRQLRFTDDGLRLVEKVRHAALLIAEAEKEAAQGAREVRGRLRLSMPAAMGRRWLSPMVAGFAMAHPEVLVKVEYAERFVDVVAEHFDAAIRIGELEDSRLVATRLCEHRRILCAAPAYLQRHGTPQVPGDLAQHNCLGFTGLRSYPEWRLTRDGVTESVQIQGTLISNDNEALLAAARLGLGIMAAGDWLVSPDIAAGHLVPVLAPWGLNAHAGIYLVRSSGRFSTAAMAAFKAWMVGQFAQGAPWRLR